MFERCLIATAGLFAVSPALSLAQLTPVSGSRWISGNISNGSGQLSSYYSNAPFDVFEFNDTRSISASSASAYMYIESNLTSTEWLIAGGANCQAEFAPAGTTASASSTTNLAMYVEAGTQLHVYCRSGGSYGGGNSRVGVLGGGLDIFIAGGQNYVIHSESILITESTTINIFGWSGNTSYSGNTTRGGYYVIHVTATAPTPGALGLLAAAALFASRRRRPSF